MSILSSDYVDRYIYEVHRREIQQEAERARRVQEALEPVPVRRRVRLPKITIHWN